MRRFHVSGHSSNWMEGSGKLDYLGNRCWYNDGRIVGNAPDIPDRTLMWLIALYEVSGLGT